MYRKDTLSNGIRVVSETLPKSRSVSIGVWVKVGSRHEPPAIGGISHFIEHMFFKGTGKRSAKDIAIEILADILLGAKFDPVEMEKERKVILEEIKGVEDTPDDYIHELFTNTVWPDNSLGRPILGTRETIKDLKHNDIVSYIDSYYHPKEIVISVAGNFEHARLIELLDLHFGKLARNGTAKKEVTPAFTRAVSVKKKQLEQVQLCIGCKGLNYTHEDRFVISALNTVLGNSMSSRLFQEVREQNALAYSIYSYVTSYRDTGLLTVYAGTDPSNALEVVRLVVKEMKNIKEEGITAAEEMRVKNQIKGSLILSLESSNSHMSRLARQEMYFGKYLSMDDIIKGVDRVTAGQVQRLAQQLFTGGNTSLTILGPLSKSDVPDEVLEI